MEEQVFNIRLHVQGVELEEGGVHNSYQMIRGGSDQGHQGHQGRYLERCHLPETIPGRNDSLSIQPLGLYWARTVRNRCTGTFGVHATFRGVW